MKKTFLFGTGIVLQYIIITTSYEIAADILLNEIGQVQFDSVVRMGTLEEMCERKSHGMFYNCTNVPKWINLYDIEDPYPGLNIEDTGINMYLPGGQNYPQ